MDGFWETRLTFTKPKLQDYRTMAKAGSIYYLEENPEDKAGRPLTVFVGASWDMKKNPDDIRKVLSFSLKGDVQGSWHYLKSMTFEDGTVIDMDNKTMLYKPAPQEQQGGGGEKAPF
jgi:hypothetical protein